MSKLLTLMFAFALSTMTPAEVFTADMRQQAVKIMTKNNAVCTENPENVTYTLRCVDGMECYQGIVEQAFCELYNLGIPRTAIKLISPFSGVELQDSDESIDDVHILFAKIQ